MALILISNLSHFIWSKCWLSLWFLNSIVFQIDIDWETHTVCRSCICELLVFVCLFEHLFVCLFEHLFVCFPGLRSWLWAVGWSEVLHLWVRSWSVSLKSHPSHMPIPSISCNVRAGGARIQPCWWTSWQQTTANLADMITYAISFVLMHP